VFAASVLPLSTAFYVCEAFGWESGVSRSFRSAPQFYVLYTGLLVIGAGVVMIPRFSLVPVMFLSQVANRMVLPVVRYYVVRLANRQDLMGRFTTSMFGNSAMWFTAVSMTILTVLSLLAQFGLW